jgi:hypothetical protein
LRIKANYAFGVTDAALTTGATTLSSPTLTRLPAVTGTNHAPVTLHDPVAGVYEIVWVTAHTASATTATIARGKEGSTALAWASGAMWTHGPTVRDTGGVGAGMRIADGVTQGSASGSRTVQNYGTLESWNDSAFTVDLTAGTITVPWDGWYHLEGRARSGIGHTGEWDAYIQPSLVQGEIRNSTSTAQVYAVKAQGVAFVTAGTAISLGMYSDVGLTLKSVNIDDRTYLRALYLGG